MFRLTILLLAGLLGVASAQNSTSTSSAYPYTIVAGSVPPQVSAGWCTSQMNSCYQVCGNRAYPNLCDAAALTYTCNCTSGPTPDLSQYNGTLLFFECQQYINQCVQGNLTNAANQQQCLAIQCGGKSPQAALSAYSSSLAAATSTSVSQSSGMATTTATGTESPAATGSSSSAHHNAAPAGADVRKAYNTGAFVVGMCWALWYSRER